MDAVSVGGVWRGEVLSRLRHHHPMGVKDLKRPRGLVERVEKLVGHAPLLLLVVVGVVYESGSRTRRPPIGKAHVIRQCRRLGEVGGVVVGGASGGMNVVCDGRGWRRGQSEDPAIGSHSSAAATTSSAHARATVGEVAQGRGCEGGGACGRGEGGGSVLVAKVWRVHPVHVWVGVVRGEGQETRVCRTREKARREC